MSRFEEVGVNRQVCAETRAQAERSFAMSCDICCNRGLRIECDRCAIQAAHERMMKVLDDVAPRIRIDFQFSPRVYAC